MAECLVRSEKLTVIADKVRALSDTTEQMSLDDICTVLDNIPKNDSNDLTASGATVTVPAGYYASNASKSVATATQATPSVSIDSSTGLITASATQTAGYVSAGTKSDTEQLTVQAAKNVTPSTSSQTAVAAGVYTTGAVTVAAIPSKYKDTSTGDATAAQVLEGKIAFNSSGKITGTMLDRNTVGKNGAVGINSGYPSVTSVPSATNLQMNTNLDNVKRLNVIVPAGYYNGSNYIGIPSANLGTATADKVMSGYTFTSNAGLNVAGTGNFVQVQTNSGTFTTNRSGIATITCGFQPDLIFIALSNVYDDGYRCTAGVTFAASGTAKVTTTTWDNDENIVDIYADRTTTGASLEIGTYDDSWNWSAYRATFSYTAIKYT